MAAEVSAGLEKFMRIISCYDFRIDEIHIDGRPLPKTTRYWFIEKLKKMADEGLIFVRHLSYLKPLGVRAAFGVKSDPVLAKTLLNIGELDNEAAGRLGFPLPYLLSTVVVMGGGRVFAAWVIPPGIDPGPVMDWGEVVLGDKVPVMACLPEPSWDDIGKLGRRLMELLGVDSIRLRTPVLPYVLVAVLDKYELITLKEMARLAVVLSARDIGLGEDVSAELKWKYLRKYYYTLSSRKLIGRILVIPKQYFGFPRVTLIGEPECASEIYGVIAVKGYAGHVYYSDEFIVANMLLDGEIQYALGLIAGKCMQDITVRHRTFLFPFPFELYDPIENRWHTRPVPGFVRLLKKIRLLSTRHTEKS